MKKQDGHIPWVDFIQALCLQPSYARTQGEDLSTNRMDLHQQLISKHCCRVQETAEICFGTSQKKLFGRRFLDASVCGWS